MSEYRDADENEETSKYLDQVDKLCGQRSSLSSRPCKIV